MRVLNIGGIPLSLGEIINFKYHLDLVKDQYDEIRLSFHKQLQHVGLHTDAPDWNHKKKLWDKYLTDIGQLFFMEKPYILEESSPNFIGDLSYLVKKINVSPKKAELGHLLCKGTPLNLGEEYIVITTKIREIDCRVFMPLSIQLWKTLDKLSKKYKIVILGEKKVEMRREYEHNKKGIYGIYEQIIVNIPNDRIVDLTVPALGETVADLSEIQQDCLIMKQAKFVITLGIGGNSCMSTAAATMAIGFRSDMSPIADIMYKKDYHNCIITKNWGHFIKTLEGYL